MNKALIPSPTTDTPVIFIDGRRGVLRGYDPSGDICIRIHRDGTGVDVWLPARRFKKVGLGLMEDPNATE